MKVILPGGLPPFLSKGVSLFKRPGLPVVCSGLLLMSLLLGMSLLGIGLAGCRGPQGAAPLPPSANRRITLTFWTLQLRTYAPYVRGLIAAYEATHPTVHIHWVDVPFSEGEKRALTAMLSPVVPDVINLNPAFAALLAQKGALLDLEQWVSPQQQQAYLPVAWQASRLGQEGPVFGIPWYLSSKVQFYNKALLQQAGFSQPPQTFVQLVALAQALGKQPPPRAYALMPPLAEAGYFFKELAGLGIPLYTRQGRAVFANHPAAAQRLQHWVQLYQTRGIPADSLTEGHQAAVDRYQAGQLALLPAGGSLVTNLATNAPQTYAATGVAPQFSDDPTLVDFSTMVLLIPKRSAHPKQAVEFALFVTNATNQLAFAQLAPVLPSTVASLQNPLFAAVRPEQPLLDQARVLSARQLRQAKRTLPVYPFQAERNALMDEAVQSALLGERTPQDALEWAQEQINQL